MPSLKSLPPRYREIVQCLISNVVIEWYFTDKKSGECADELVEIFELNDDPFTGLPVSDQEYFDSKKKYEAQVAKDRYGDEQLFYDWMGFDPD